MSRLYVGNRVQNVDIGESPKKITRVTINVDSDHAYTAGDDTGRTIERECPWGSQEMADSLLRKLSGVVYKPFNAERAMISPAFEIGDPVTVGGVYSQIVGADINYRISGLVDIYAPELDETEDEYPSEKTQQSSIARQLAGVRAAITKSTEEIRAEVADDINELSSSVDIELGKIRQEVQGAEDAISYLEVDLEAISGRVQDAEGNIGALELEAANFGVRIEDAEGNIAELEVSTEEIEAEVGSISVRISELEGLTVTDETGTTKVSGSSVETKTLKVDAANIEGELIIGKQLPSNLATTEDIPTSVSDLENDSGFQTKSGVTSIVEGVVTTDYVNALSVTAGSVSASNITAGTMIASRLTLSGLLEVVNGTARGFVGANNTKGGVVIADDSASVYCIATNAAAKMSYYEEKMIWVASGGCYSNETMQVYSDRTLKNSVSYDLGTEEKMFELLQPCSFVYNSDLSKKKHWGFVAQDFIQSAEAVGMKASDLAVVGEYEGKYSLGYGEITALNTLMIQKLMKRMDAIEDKVEV